MCKHLEEDLSCHGEAVGDDGLFIWGFALPAVQLQAAAAGQQALPVHLRRGHTRELTSCRVTDELGSTCKYIDCLAVIHGICKLQSDWCM